MRVIRYFDKNGITRFGLKGTDASTYRADGDPLAPQGLNPTAEPVEIAQILCPIAPAMIYGIGLNYRKHAQETKAPIPDYPVVFVKATTAAWHPQQAIRIPQHQKSERVDYECELVIIISKRCKNVSRHNALDYILGYTCGNDVSARDWQIKYSGGQWCRGKSYDTFAPMGPELVTVDELGDASNLPIRTYLNNELMQESNTSDMIFSVPEIIEFLSSSTTLEPGTAIFTGTPSGVGMARNPRIWLQPGDTVTVEIDHIGQLTNTVELEDLS